MTEYHPQIGDIVRVHATHLIGVVTLTGDAPGEPYAHIVHRSGYTQWLGSSHFTKLGNVFDDAERQAASHPP
jgi:hypothetical protein